MTMLIERYIGAALEEIPDRQRDDTAREIRAAIDEMVELRMVSGEPESVATEHALNELGDPRRLAASYAERPQHLIGAGWYPRYIALLKQILTIVVPLVAIVTLLTSIGVDDKSVINAVGDAAGSVAMAIVQIGFWLTLGFAIAERVAKPEGSMATKERWTVTELPKEPKARQITLGDVAPDVIAMVVLAALAVLTFTDGIGILVRGASDAIKAMPLINPDLGAGWVVGFFALVALSIESPIARYMRGYWTRPMLVLEALDSAFWIVYMIALAASAPIINPEFAERVDPGSTWWETGGTANVLIAVSVIVVSLQTAWEAWTGHRAYRRQYQGLERAAEEENRWTV
jgi:hypothetical protein